MKINDVLFNFLLEEFQNKKLLNACILKWFGSQPTPQQNEKADYLLTKYYELKVGNKLSTKNPSIVTFINRFPNFNVEGLPLATSFSLEEMEFLIDEFFGDSGGSGVDNDIPEVLRGKNLRPTDERIEASKNLWFARNRFLVVDEGDFRVYVIPDRATSINYGYYEGYMSNLPFYKNAQSTVMQWCTTRYEVNNNLYGSYRSGSKERTFYFVIDETKSPDVESSPQKAQYYLSALQTAKDSPTGYRLTTILNDGTDHVMTEEQLINIYPKLRGHFDKIRPIEYDLTTELGESADIVDMINETPGSQYEFSKIQSRFKKAYIDRGKPIEQIKSWQSMDENLKNAYINITDAENAEDRFKEQLFNFIKDDKSNRAALKSLDNRLKVVGLDGIKYLNKKIIVNKYKPYRKCKLSNDIEIFVTYTNPKRYGIYNIQKAEWLNQNGRIYGPEYTNLKMDVFKSPTEPTNRYFVEIFSKSSQPSDDSFVSLYLNTDRSVKGVFMSYSSWLELKEKEKLRKEGEDVEVDVMKHGDIKERQ